ncbi:hypothetical protein WT83_15790 [Burkholderia territorii]|uniref:Uncharacterized protein n=1 Tax=Burkholderia territorii TaxID=1503055 RepID=A0A119VK73_9BURK|nr:hypothetical protein WT83_15790 [Burkholderia territorii]
MDGAVRAVRRSPAAGQCRGGRPAFLPVESSDSAVFPALIDSPRIAFAFHAGFRLNAHVLSRP